MKIKDLTPAHLHRKITVVTDDWSITGTLRYIEVESDEFTEKNFAGEVQCQTYGPTEIELGIGPWRASELPENTEVIIH